MGNGEDVVVGGKETSLLVGKAVPEDGRPRAANRCSSEAPSYPRSAKTATAALISGRAGREEGLISEDCRAPGRPRAGKLPLAPSGWPCTSAADRGEESPTGRRPLRVPLWRLPGEFRETACRDPTGKGAPTACSSRLVAREKFVARTSKASGAPLGRSGERAARGRWRWRRESSASQLFPAAATRRIRWRVGSAAHSPVFLSSGTQCHAPGLARQSSAALTTCGRVRLLRQLPPFIVGSRFSPELMRTL